MRTRRGSLLAVALVVFGCKPVERGSDEPMPTTGPHQVVLKLPAMSCAGCPVSVSEALAALTWIDSATIQTDGKLRQVKFAVTDPARFDLEEIAVPVQLSFGLTDVFVPPGHGHWLASRIAGCATRIDDEAGHFAKNPASEIRQRLQWLLDRRADAACR